MPADPRPDPGLSSCPNVIPIRGPIPDPGCGDSGAVVRAFSCSRSAVAELRFLAVLRTGCKVDTPPLWADHRGHPRGM
jgi:hypothetical protein